VPDRRDFSGDPHFHSFEELPYERPGTPYSVTGERNYLRRFRVIVRHSRMNALSVCLCPGVPIPGSFFLTETSYDTLALVTQIDARQEHSDDWQNWIVEVRYSTRMPQGGFPTLAGVTPGSQDHPELEPAVIRWDAKVVQYKPRWDLDGKLYKNRADQLFKGAAFPVGHGVLVIERNELDFNAYKAMTYNFALNSDTFLGFPPETVQCQPPTAQQMHRGPTAYYRVNYRLEFGYLIEKEEGIHIIKPDGTVITDDDKDYKEDSQGRPVGLRKWQPRILNSGTTHRPGIDLDPIRTYDHGSAAEKLLDRNGLITTTPHYIRFRQFRKMSFSELVVSGLA
jgi:hypothetical protein